MLQIFSEGAYGVHVRCLAPLLMRLADARFDSERLRVAAVQMQQLFAILQREIETPLARVLACFLKKEFFTRGVGES